MPEFELVFNRLDTLSYVGIFFIFIIPFLPIPEELLLLGIGYLASLGDWNVYWAIAASAAGIIISDNLWFWLGKTHSKFALKLRRRIGEEKIVAYERLLRNHTWKYIFLFRLIPGARAVGPAFAGWGNASAKKFWFYDILAIFFYTPLLILVGFYFNYNLDIIRSRLISAKHIIFILFLVLVGLTIAYLTNKNFFRIGFRK